MTLPDTAATTQPDDNRRKQLGYKLEGARGWTIAAGVFLVGILAAVGYSTWYVYTPSKCPDPCYGQIAIGGLWFLAFPFLIGLLVLGVIQGVRWQEFSYQLKQLAKVIDTPDVTP